MSLAAGSPCADGFSLDVHADEFANLQVECVQNEDPRPAASTLPVYHYFAR